MEILIYPIVIVSILLVPNRLVDSLYNIVAKKILRVKHKFSGDYARGNELYNKSLMINNAQGRFSLPEYKFYTSLMLSICKQALDFGSPVKVPLDYIRKALLKDLRSEKLVNSQKYSAFGVFSCAALITWGFSGFTLYLFGKGIGSFLSLSNIAMLVWQTLGIFSFYFIFERLKKKFLNPFEVIFSRVYSFSLLCSVGLSLNETLRLSKINDFFDIDIKGFSYFKGRLRNLIELRQNQGLETSHELELLIEQLWGFYEDKFEALKKRIQVLKFVWLCLFFLMTYLVSIYSTMQSLM